MAWSSWRNPCLRKASNDRGRQTTWGSTFRRCAAYPPGRFLSSASYHRCSGLTNFLNFWFGFGSYWKSYRKNLCYYLSSSPSQPPSSPIFLFQSCPSTNDTHGTCTFDSHHYSWNFQCLLQRLVSTTTLQSRNKPDWSYCSHRQVCSWGVSFMEASKWRLIFISPLATLWFSHFLYGDFIQYWRLIGISI